MTTTSAAQRDSFPADADHGNSRFMLWIDGVGGVLFCEGSSIVIGQPARESQADVPIMADLSRRHARIVREGEHYMFEPLRSSWLAGRRIERPVRLSDDAVLELGDDVSRSVRLRFLRPNACSGTARLDVVSRHRLHPHADGVVLLAESCLIGPAADCHIRAPALRRTLILGRRPDGVLLFRDDVEYAVDGARRRGTSVVARTATIRGPDFSMRLEPLIA